MKEEMFVSGFNKKIHFDLTLKEKEVNFKFLDLNFKSKIKIDKDVLGAKFFFSNDESLFLYFIKRLENITKERKIDLLNEYEVKLLIIEVFLTSLIEFGCDYGFLKENMTFSISSNQEYEIVIELPEVFEFNMSTIFKVNVYLNNDLIKLFESNLVDINFLVSKIP